MNAPHLFSKRNPLKIFVLFSGEASSIRHLRHSSVEYGYRYRIIGSFSSNENAPGIDFFKNHTDHHEKFTPKLEGAGEAVGEHIPCEVLDWKTFNHPTDKRRAYFQEIMKIIERYEIDLILCAGFKIIIPDFFIQECGVPIINDHPADLTVINNDGTPRYAGNGLDAIARTVQDGCKFICSTVHFVEIGPVDSGRIICQSPQAKIESGVDLETLRKRIKWICSGPAIDKALQMITRGEILLSTNHTNSKEKYFFQKIIQTLSKSLQPRKHAKALEKIKSGC